MPLLRSLEKLEGVVSYRHGAPLELFNSVHRYNACEEHKWAANDRNQSGRGQQHSKNSRKKLAANPSGRDFSAFELAVTAHIGEVKRRRRSLLFLVACLLVIFTTALLWTGQKEPEYQGRKLSEWLILSRRSVVATVNSPSPEAAENAVHQIGTNAIPCLLRWLQHRNPPWRERMWEQIAPVAFRIVGRSATYKFILHLDYQQEMAQWGFEILGEDAQSAVPELERVLNSHRDYSGNAIRALSSVGTAGLRPLLNVITNRSSDSISRLNSIAMVGCMDRIGTNAAPAVPVLMEYLEDPEVGPYAVNALGKLGLRSEVCVPALVRSLSPTNAELCLNAIRALGNFGARAQEAVPALERMLSEPEDFSRDGGAISSGTLRVAITNALQAIAPTGLTNSAAQ